MRTEVRTFEIEEITRILDAGGNYREKFSEQHARVHLAEMLAGRWVQPHTSPIVLSRNGKRDLDGQHRLWAAREYCRETGKKIKFLVVYADQDEEALSLTIDTGKKRTISDYLRHMGVANATTVAACLAIVARVGDGKVRAFMFDNTRMLSVSEMAATFEKEKSRILEASELALACRDANIGSVGLLAGIAYLIGKKNRSGCRIFFQRLASQTGLDEGDPILRLLRYFQDRKGEGTRRAVVRRAMHAAVVIKAWNAWATGERPKVLRWSINGDKPEDFPQIEKGEPSLFGAE